MMFSKRRLGFSLVELLVVINIIGLLIALLLPAVQGAREVARRTRCKSHLRQIGLAALLHEEAHGHMPTGGWGNQWVGDPDRGFGVGQPGGWIYNILPYMDEASIHDLPKNKSGEAKRRATIEMLTRPVDLFNCPSRRSADLYEYHAQEPLRNAEVPLAAPKTDYAVNGGDVVLSGGGGPASADAQDIRTYQWPPHEEFNGIAFVGSRIRNAQITDGTSSTYLVGEKLRYFYPDRMIGDDQTLCMGDDADIRRWTAEPPAHDSGSGADWDRFGSAHTAGCYFAFCDGSVQLVSYDADPETHRRLGNRRDGLPAFEGGR